MFRKAKKAERGSGIFKSTIRSPRQLTPGVVFPRKSITSEQYQAISDIENLKMRSTSISQRRHIPVFRTFYSYNAKLLSEKPFLNTSLSGKRDYVPLLNRNKRTRSTIRRKVPSDNLKNQGNYLDYRKKKYENVYIGLQHLVKHKSSSPDVKSISTQSQRDPTRSLAVWNCQNRSISSSRENHEIHYKGRFSKVLGVLIPSLRNLPENSIDTCGLFKNEIPYIAKLGHKFTDQLISIRDVFTEIKKEIDVISEVDTPINLGIL